MFLRRDPLPLSPRRVELPRRQITRVYFAASSDHLVDDRHRALITEAMSAPARNVASLAQTTSSVTHSQPTKVPKPQSPGVRLRRFVPDSPLEGTGFELPVRGCDESGFRSFCVSRQRERDRKFVDSPLEEAGFELIVPLGISASPSS